MKESIILYIDTSEIYTAKVAVEYGGKKYEKTSESTVMKSQMILLLIDELLAAHEVGLADVREIRVNPGPGSYTGIRVGLAVANMLSTLLHIPVNGQMSLATPTYS